jgi:uncharacterized protein with PIN domain
MSDTIKGKIVAKCLEDPLDVEAEARRCPECESDDIDKLHHRADSIPECWYWVCNECERQWGHE